MTRRERYEKQRARHQNRLRRYTRKFGSSSRSYLTNEFLPPSPWPIPPGEQMQSLQLSPEERRRQPPAQTVEFPPFIVISKPSRGVLPVVAVNWPAGWPAPDRNRVKRNGIVDYHKKPRRIVPTKPGRANGYGRRLFFAARNHFLRGWWPDDDPMGRRPNETDVFFGGVEADPLGSWV